MRRPRTIDEQRRDPVVRAVRPAEPGGEARGTGSRVPARLTAPAGRALAVMLTCLFVWLLLDAPALKRAAEASEIGARRSAALVILGPLAAISEALQLDHVRGAISTAVGRDPSEEPGVASIEPVPIAPPEAGEGGEEADVDAPIPVPTRDDPLRVAVIGDSFATGVGSAIGRALNPRLINVQARGVISTGLTRPDYFNWQPNLREIVDRFRPGVVVVMLGGNDAQTLTVPGGKPVPQSAQGEWRRIYAERVESLATTATDAGARVVWIGLPPMRDVNRDHQARRLDDIYRDVASANPGVAYVNSLDLFARPGGGYSAYLPDADGDERLVREGDGEHFTSLGYDWVADAVVEALEKHWELPAAAVER